VSRLTCEGCGLIYSRAAIARQMALATGVGCGRCGGTLKAEEARADRGGRASVQAVRAAAYGLERRPSGWRHGDDRGPDRLHPRPDGFGRH
jgi:hypothetical protein